MLTYTESRVDATEPRGLPRKCTCSLSYGASPSIPSLLSLSYISYSLPLCIPSLSAQRSTPHSEHLVFKIKQNQN